MVQDAGSGKRMHQQDHGAKLIEADVRYSSAWFRFLIARPIKQRVDA